MTQYFKQHLSADLFIFSAFYGEGQVSASKKTIYPVRESAFFCKNFPKISRYSIDSNWAVENDLVPCSKEEFEAAKQSALNALTTMIEEVTLYPINHNVCV